MSEDPVKAIDEAVCRIDEAVGLSKGPCSGWLKRAPMDEVVNWLVNNVKQRLLNARQQVSDRGSGDTLEALEKIEKYKTALTAVVQLEQEMNESVSKSGYATGGEAGHYFYRAVKVAKEALKS